MTNEQMKPNRFAIWASARKQYRFISDAFAAGKRVTVATYTKATTYSAKHSQMFKVTKSGCYVQRGKNWDCLSGVKLIAHL